MKYNKLVRDKIPAIIKQNGQTPLTHMADQQEYWLKLKQKLQEEVDEFQKSDKVEELADVLEVIEAICDFKKFKQKELLAVKNKKAERRGKFIKKIILEEVE